jgi:hypothetical protein
MGTMPAIPVIQRIGSHHLALRRSLHHFEDHAVGHPQHSDEKDEAVEDEEQGSHQALRPTHVTEWV